MRNPRPIYVLVSPHGAIGGYLLGKISRMQQIIESITWRELSLLLDSNSFLDFLELHRIKYGRASIFILYCSAVKRSISEELQTLKRVSDALLTNSKYEDVRLIYFSTYEPQRHASTKYRKIKAAAEAYLLKQNHIFIRVGLFDPHDHLFNKRKSSHGISKKYIVASYRKFPVTMPVTSGTQLVRKILDIDFTRPDCYTSYVVFCIGFLGLGFDDCEYVSSQNLVPVSYLINGLAKMALLCSSLLPDLPCLAPINSLLQKPASLLDHQKAFREVNHL